MLFQRTCLGISLLFFITLTACGIQEKIENIRDLQRELISTFGHEDIDLSVNWGTEENFINVSFYKYPVDSVTYPQLESKAGEVFAFLLSQNPAYQNLDYINVRFTKEPDTAEEKASFISFRKEVAPSL